MVAAVPTTPITVFRVARQAASAPGPITPTTGSFRRCCRSGRATADMVLQAMTSALMPRRSRKRAPSRA
jgi:hypothetical protein